MIPACLASTFAPIQQEASPITQSFRIHLEQNNTGSCDFYHEWSRQCKVLILGNQSIYHICKAEFDEIKSLEDKQQEICQDMEYETSDETFTQKLQAQYDELEEEIESKKESLKSKVTADFNRYLQRLGESREHLAPQIARLFSPKALTALSQLVDQKCHSAFKGIYMGKTMAKSVTLHIASSGSIEITASHEALYTQFLADGKTEPKTLHSPSRCTSFARYTIQGNGTIEAIGSFKLTP